MNIVIANKYKSLLSNLEDTQVLDGTYNADSLVEMLRNFRYDKIIIDLTSINNYSDLGNIRLLASLNPNSVVLFLDDNKKCASKEFLAKLVNSGFYNFTRNLEGVKHLLASPNTFDVVASVVKGEEKKVEIEKEEKKEDTVIDRKIDEVKPQEDIPKETNDIEELDLGDNKNNNEALEKIDKTIEAEKKDIDKNLEKANENVNNIPIFDTSEAENKLNAFVEPTSVNYLDVDVPKVSEPTKIEGGVVDNTPVNNDFLKYSTYSQNSDVNNENKNNTFIQEDVDNSTNNDSMLQYQQEDDKMNYTYTPNAFTEYEDITGSENENEAVNYTSGRKVIGVKNLTQHAGATSFIYMMYKELVKNSYNVIAIEVDEFDFVIYKERNFINVTKSDLVKTIQKYPNADFILLDLNTYEDTSICDDVLYLVEPSMVMLNKLMLKDKDTFKKLKGKKIILNKSLLDESDIKDFEYEAKTKVFYNMPPLSDRAKTNKEIINLLNKMQIKM